MSKTKSFKIPYGERDGVLLHISDVDRGMKCNCRCPVCKGVLVARKGEKTKHHFGHYPGANCSAETVLHQLGKQLLYDRICSAIKERRPLPVSWECEHCYSKHDGDLVKVAASARMEMDFGTCRPDVALLKSDGSPCAFLEIVVSHKPDENVLAYVAEKGLTLAEFHIQSSEDLERLGQSQVLTPTKLDLCTRPKCLQCRQPLYRKMLHVVDGKCRGDCEMKIAVLMVEGSMYGPENFSERDSLVARKAGAILKENFSHWLGETYLSNTCPHCGKFIGRNLLHDYVVPYTLQGGQETGLFCVECKRHY